MWHKSSDTLSTFVTPLSRMGVEREKLIAQAFKGAFDLTFLLFNIFSPMGQEDWTCVPRFAND